MKMLWRLSREAVRYRGLYVIAILATLGLTAVMKSLFASVFGDAVWPSFPRYFLTVFFAGAVWPRTFPFFSKIGGKK